MPFNCLRYTHSDIINRLICLERSEESEQLCFIDEPDNTVLVQTRSDSCQTPDETANNTIFCVSDYVELLSSTPPDKYVLASMENCRIRKPSLCPLPFQQIDLPFISTQNALEAFYCYMRQYPFWKRLSMKNMTILQERMEYAYKIDIDTHYEYREIAWSKSARSTQHSAPMNLQNSPQPWEISVESKGSRNGAQEIEIPFISTVCTACRDKRPEHDRIREVCSACGGSGVIHCHLTMRDSFDIDNYNKCIVCSDAITEADLEGCCGYLVYCVKGERLLPTDICIDNQVNRGIRKAFKEIERHMTYNQSRIHHQEFYMSIIPIRTITCSTGTEVFQFSVYDHDHHVLCNHFPHLIRCTI